MKALIVEDEKMACTQLARILSAEFPEIEIAAMTDSVASTVQYLKDRPAPDIIFMDVELLDGDCFEIFRRVEVHSKVIMTTAYDTYAIKAFEVGGIDYLLKPVGIEALRRAVGRARAMSIPETADKEQSYPEYFTVRVGDRIVPLSVKEVAFFYSEDKANCIMTAGGGRYLIESTLEQVESRIDPAGFFRISRGTVVARSAIREAARHLSGRLLLSTIPAAPFEMTVSRARVDDFLRWLGICPRRIRYFLP